MRHSAALLALALLASSARAQPAHTLDIVVYDPTTLVVRMVVIPDSDKQLDDPAFHPTDCGPLQNLPCAAVKVPHIQGQDPLQAVADATGTSVTLQPPVAASNAVATNALVSP